MTTPLLKVTDLVRTFGGEKAWLGFGKNKPAVHAVRTVSFDLTSGETLGIVGESGCGKSTLARMLSGLDKPSSGSIELEGNDVTALSRRDIRSLARSIQYVFQDPVGSLNPRKTIRQILETPLIHLLGFAKEKRAEAVSDLMRDVNLHPDFLDRYPHEFSGGQAQRIGIARALAARARILILDEPVSALDVSVQSQVLNLLADLKSRNGLSYVFISHDLSVVEGVSDRVAVMYFGSIVELGAARNIFKSPRHPYTRLLLDSAPVPGKRTLNNPGVPAELPDPLSPPLGCAFKPRCHYANSQCDVAPPLLDVADADEHHVACHFPLTSRATSGDE